MAKTFKGFTNQQTHQLLKEMGFTGPAQKDEMDAFLASSPSAASKMGRYTEIAKQRVEGGPLSGVGMQAGGTVTNDQTAILNEANVDRARREREEAGYKDASQFFNNPATMPPPPPRQARPDPTVQLAQAEQQRLRAKDQAELQLKARKQKVDEEIEREKLNLNQQKLATEILKTEEGNQIQKEKLASQILKEGIN